MAFLCRQRRPHAIATDRSPQGAAGCAGAPAPFRGGIVFSRQVGLRSSWPARRVTRWGGGTNRPADQIVAGGSLDGGRTWMECRLLSIWISANRRRISGTSGGNAISDGRIAAPAIAPVQTWQVGRLAQGSGTPKPSPWQMMPPAKLSASRSKAASRMTPSWRTRNPACISAPRTAARRMILSKRTVLAGAPGRISSSESPMAARTLAKANSKSARPEKSCRNERFLLSPREAAQVSLRTRVKMLRHKAERKRLSSVETDVQT